ncbi:MAG TPA: methyltransferase domain-containing protein [Acidothermaceae bacterium]
MTDPADAAFDVRADVRAAYDATGAAWDNGPRRIYDQLAIALLDRCPVPFDHARAVDAGAGTGAATNELVRRGASVTAVDLSAGMLRCLDPKNASLAVGDVVALPIRTDAVDIAMAAFVLNHLPQPIDALRELARITHPAGAVLVSVFGEAPPHPSKDAIDGVARLYGFTAPAWHRRLKEEFEAQTSTPEPLATLARQAGLVDVSARVEHIQPTMTDDDLVGWRTGMAHLAPFIATLPTATAQALADDARAAVVGMPPLDIAMVTLVARPLA